ncbi:helix-turn-helix transcriptional regulator [Pseudonocardia sp. DSM 110487]|uniref:helix-turn-helix domain-containing protein n=1 Tax=Pseudonocardia sp. DSM 110487 TaxID=2865833 RepID=UPI001C6A0F7A|nr:helix-turn-helix transcriptional regulator [Pseudonocardia sp. DSM 110487]QYN34626.1 helix-turn-helix transcriptional regulator [Pseudonocardia sp. DSM 110487]
MTGRIGAGGLRAARAERGWSQSQAARELVTLARSSGAPVAGAASLKTLLSRWENGHAVPEPQYRALLGELYGRTPAELGIAAPPADPAAAGAPARFRAALAAAAALDEAALALWREQLDVATRLDDELGATGAGELVRALVERLDETGRHTLAPSRRAAVATVLAPAAILAGGQELDRGRPDIAWQRYDLARTAAAEADLPDAAADVVAGQATVLIDVGEAAAAISLLDAVEPALPRTARPRVAGARAGAAAALGDATAARRAISAVSRRLPADTVEPAVAVELADLDRWHGHALTVLGDPAAAHPLRRALTAPPRSARHRAAVHADLALTLAVEHPDDAAAHARAAHALAERIGSTRTQERLAALRPSATPHAP